MAQVVDLDVTRLTVEWSTNKGNFRNDQTSVFQFLGSSWYIQCFVNDHDMYRITLQNQNGHEHIADGFHVTTSLFANGTYFLQSVRNVQNPRRRLWEFHEDIIADHISCFDFNAQFIVVCKFDEEYPFLAEDNRSETNAYDWPTLNDFDQFDSSSSLPDGKHRSNKSVQASLELPPELESLSLDFCNLLKNEDIPDVQLRCGKCTIPAHRAVLAARSEVFAAMFRNKMVENETGIVDITDMEAQILEIFLKYIYTGRTSTPTDDVLPKLYVAGDKYAVHTLKRACSEWMIGSLTTENCLDILKLADAHSDTYLEAAVVNFVVGDVYLLKSEVWYQFEKEHPILALSVYRKAFQCLGAAVSK